MKVYPIIYGRTKFVDYLPDFLVRPHDLEVKEAFYNVSVAIEKLDRFKGIRCCAFSTTKYTVAGVACYLDSLAEKCGVKEDEHVKDSVGRLIAGFVGIVLEKGEGKNLNTNIDIDEQFFWRLYKEYICEQWTYPCDVHTVLLNESNLVEIEENGEMYTPKKLGSYEDKTIVGDNGVANLSFYIREVSYNNINGYLSLINKVELLQKVKFAHVTVTSDLMNKLQNKKGQEIVSNIPKPDVSSVTKLQQMRKLGSDIVTSSKNIEYTNKTEKNNSFLCPLMVIGAIIGGTILLLLILCQLMN